MHVEDHVVICGLESSRAVVYAAAVRGKDREI